MIKQTLGWTAPKLREPDAADRWTWLVITAHTQLRLARPLAEDLRKPGSAPQNRAASPLPASAKDFGAFVGRLPNRPAHQNPARQAQADRPARRTSAAHASTQSENSAKRTLRRTPRTGRQHKRQAKPPVAEDESGCTPESVRPAPDEGPRVVVPVGDPDPDVLLQCLDVPVDSAPHLLARQQGEPAFHLIEPGRAGRGEVHAEPGMGQQPLLDRGRLVGGALVADQMDVEMVGDLLVQLGQELLELHRAVLAVERAMTSPVAAFRAANRVVTPPRR